jgi:16S rRNA U1498 N3-methylase RsmE
MGLQHVENLLRRHRGQVVNIRTMFGGVYEGVISDINSDYVTLTVENSDTPKETYVLLQSIEAVQSRKQESKAREAANGG